MTQRPVLSVLLVLASAVLAVPHTGSAAPDFPIRLAGEARYDIGLVQPIEGELYADGTCFEVLTGLTCVWSWDAASKRLDIDFADGTVSRGHKRDGAPCIAGELIAPVGGHARWYACLVE